MHLSNCSSPAPTANMTDHKRKHAAVDGVFDRSIGVSTIGGLDQPAPTSAASTSRPPSPLSHSSPLHVTGMATMPRLDTPSPLSSAASNDGDEPRARKVPKSRAVLTSSCEACGVALPSLMTNCQKCWFSKWETIVNLGGFAKRQRQTSCLAPAPASPNPATDPATELANYRCQ